ncbi:flagellar hook-associated family protein [Aquibium sp. A9E412]|uniref:flagellar hook-associated family protein n=1 Tax=Aquibium sp. A9E412 TaxID=2976767 RepID=UPI0025AFAFDE|nr:flagellar hook-associated family protein [Aquibium sp. A9E412]MDN2567254.1 flagellar hook-associated family protein [Aquibium sp. A9E412]
MKLAAISTQSVNQALRYQLMRVQAEMAERNQETVSGRLFDPGKTLGARSANTVSLTREIDRLGSLLDSNALAGNRLAASQDALSQLNDVGQSLLAALTSATSGTVSNEIVRAEGTRALGALTSVMNTNLNGEYLFAGINTDVKPFDDYTAPGSPAKAAFDAAFVGHFGFAQSDPAAAGISAADMQVFLDTVVEPQFLGAGWQGTWSSATDERIVSRIALNETAETSISANTAGTRKLAMAAVAVADLLQGPLNAGARDVLYARATQLVGEGLADLADTQGAAGVVQNRITDASARIDMQIDLFERSVNDLEGVDPFAASARVSELQTQLELSYTLTARLQQLSLMRFLS